MIKEDYVSYEVAKLLKEKGFDESTEFVWYQYLPTSLDCQGLANKKARDYFFHNETTEHRSTYCNSRSKPKYIQGDIFSCPTHQMAMKWLREEHKLSIEISSTESGRWMAFVYELGLTRHFVEAYISTYDTYEDAVEAALKYCLTKLI